MSGSCCCMSFLLNELLPSADRGAEFVPAREWMRICFELLDLLKAHKKGIRRAAVNSFGYIAKSLGPQDVLSVLLTNLRVQERQSRVCSTVAIAIVAETCGPFTCIPAILNEYRTAELNVRTGCLKALSFVFEYVGPQSAYYVDSVVTMLEDALTDRDLVHRQTASTIVKHLALGVAGLGCEDSMMHLMNLVWPNCFETSPHVIGAVMEAIEAMRVTLGPGTLLSYVLQGLFHPARKVREVSNSTCPSCLEFWFADGVFLFFCKNRSIGASTTRCTSAQPMPSYRFTPMYQSSARVRTCMTGTRCECSCNSQTRFFWWGVRRSILARSCTLVLILWLSTCYSLLLTIYCKTKRDSIVSFSGLSLLITRDKKTCGHSSIHLSQIVKFVDCQPR